MKKLSKILCFVSMVSLLPMNVLADGDVYDFTIDGVGYSFGHGFISEEFKVADNSVLSISSYNGSKLVDVNSMHLPTSLKVSDIMQATNLSPDYNWDFHKDEIVPISEEYNELYVYDSNNKVNVSAIKGAEQTEILFDEQEPIIAADTTLLPIRSIAEFYGWNVTWDGDAREVKITDDIRTVTIPVDKRNIFVDNKYVSIDVPSMVLNDKTLVPVRAVSEALGLNVEWIGETSTVVLSN